MHTRLTWLAISLAGLFSGFALACADAGTEDECQVGTFNCACLAGTCQSGLACQGGVCVFGGDGDGDGDGDSNGDGDGDGDGDAGCDDECEPGEFCIEGECTLPPSCPCPPEWFCPAAGDTCFPGCVEQENCGDGDYCDVATKECKPGCFDDEDCPGDQRCDVQEHTCFDPCEGCEDDGNPCTYESCDGDTCNTGDAQAGTACSNDDTGNTCTTFACDGSGSCAEQDVFDGTECDSENPCVSDASCQSGTCTASDYFYDGWACDSENQEVCMNGTCETTKRVCSWSDTVYSGGDHFDVWLCGCGSNVLFRYWYDVNDNFPVETDCSSCVELTGSKEVCWP